MVNNLCHTYSCRIPILEVWRNMQAQSVNKPPDSDAGGLGTTRGRPRLISGWAEVETIDWAGGRGAPASAFQPHGPSLPACLARESVQVL